MNRKLPRKDELLDKEEKMARSEDRDEDDVEGCGAS